MKTTRSLLALGVAALLAACAGPIRVEHADPQEVHRSLTQSALSTGELSGDTRNLLRRVGLLEIYEREPEVALEAAHGMLREGSGRNRRQEILAAAVVALAEASFLHASRSGDRAWFLAAAIYAWAYLFPEVPHQDPYDPRLRLAADLYNRALTLGVLDGRTGDVRLGAARLELPFGALDVRFDEKELQWGARRFTSFAPVSELAVEGMRNRYRDWGLGAAFAASTDSPARGDARVDLVYERVRVPVSVLLVFDDVHADIADGTFGARLEVHPDTGPQEVEINGRRVPLEMERTATLALMLTETAPWKREIAGFFQGDLARKHEGLVSLAPHQPGRIPVILVHGTASSTATWANLLNDLTSERAVRDAYEFWLFTYNTGAPVAYSALLLRKALDDMIEKIDPESLDPSLRQAVVIGHSQGGLLTKLMTVESGEAFWGLISDRPFSETPISGESRALIEGSLFVEPHPAVARVVFIATPHRGSFLASYAPARWLGKLVRSPANVVRAVTDLVTADPEAAAQRKLDDVDGALGNMSPGSDFLRRLVALPPAPNIGAHSIIAVRELNANMKEDGSDGVVEYRSAHLDEVESELVVESGHSCLSHPDVIGETRRILLSHLLSAHPRPER